MGGQPISRTGQRYGLQAMAAKAAQKPRYKPSPTLAKPEPTDLRVRLASGDLYNRQGLARSATADRNIPCPLPEREGWRHRRSSEIVEMNRDEPLSLLRGGREGMTDWNGAGGLASNSPAWKASTSAAPTPVAPISVERTLSVRS